VETNGVTNGSALLDIQTGSTIDLSVAANSATSAAQPQPVARKAVRHECALGLNANSRVIGGERSAAGPVRCRLKAVEQPRLS